MIARAGATTDRYNLGQHRLKKILKTNLPSKEAYATNASPAWPKDMLRLVSYSQREAPSQHLARPHPTRGKIRGGSKALNLATCNVARVPKQSQCCTIAIYIET